MQKLVTEELMHLQKKLESLETKEYRDNFTNEQLELFKLDIKLTMNLLLKNEMRGDR